MKLCRYGKPGYEKPGVIDGEGRLRDLSKVIDNIGPNEISPRQLKTLSRLKADTLPLVNSSPRFGVPYVGIGKFVAIGLNYVDHAKEAGMPIPSEPIVFMKATTCISGPNDDAMPPSTTITIRSPERVQNMIDGLMKSVWLASRTPARPHITPEMTKQVSL